MVQVQNILLPTDFSEPSLPATQWALDLARRYGAALHLLHVIEDPVVYIPIFESYPLPSREEFEQFAQTRLDNWILPEDAEGLQIERHWVHGDPYHQILDHVKSLPAEMVVVGTHGRGMAMQMLLGSVAEKVVRHAPCPVVTIRSGESTE